MSEPIIRCFWVNLNNPAYVKYHDEEWAAPCHDDQKLYELLIYRSGNLALPTYSILPRASHSLLVSMECLQSGT